ncbi:hypothetical protein [Dyadobacter sp. LHD-138]|uniref:hypothetical protein n=1 Tax=Dyadobacter sp. LHD-138 TaxID=3071413 RepID=UPI0027E03E89|nr:hypothetical protein [Dyadobacter sp. LHD-138]MDQ6480172.1 hypothetical protein [Dyadobacter sp. LHD-138]
MKKKQNNGNNALINYGCFPPERFVFSQIVGFSLPTASLPTGSYTAPTYYSTIS